VLKIFNEGKSLEDFDRLVDQELNEFYGPESANVLLPIFEPEVSMNKYLIMGFKENMHLLLGIRKMFISGVDFNDYKTYNTIFNRIKKRYISAKATKYMNLELFSEKGKQQFKGLIEHVGLYKNLHNLNCKLLAEFLGIIGLKIYNFLYSEEDLYYRLEFVPTELFFTQNLEIEKRIELMRHNVEYIINYYRVLDDATNHLWIKMADDNEVIINFKNEICFQIWKKETFKY